MTPIHDAAFRGNTKLYHALVKSSQNTNTNAVVDLTIKDKLGYISSEYIGNYQYEFPPELPATKC